MAVMSTHPRDYKEVMRLSNELPRQVRIQRRRQRRRQREKEAEEHCTDEEEERECSGDDDFVRVIPCFGVHPWFLHELSSASTESCDSNGWKDVVPSSSSSIAVEGGDVQNPALLVPKWVVELEGALLEHPQSIVGEIGLDGFRFDPTSGDLVSSISSQVTAFEQQLDVATRLQRPVSIHCVQCFGPLMTTISAVKKRYRGTLPLPKLYFHAFGGKAGTVDQLVAMCNAKDQKGQQQRKDEQYRQQQQGSSSSVYFGFAPVINFRSPKTADLVRKVGIRRLLLETDHEDASRVQQSIEECIGFYSDALQISEDEVVRHTTKNAFDFYGIVT